MQYFNLFIELYENVGIVSELTKVVGIKDATHMNILDNPYRIQLQHRAS